MNCKHCNTRLTASTGPCPNCGRGERSSRFIDSKDEKPAADDSRSRLQPLSPSSAKAEEPVDIDLEEEVEIPLEEALEAVKKKSTPSPATTGSASGRSSAKPAGAKSPAVTSASRKSGPASSASASESAFVAIPPEQIRHMIATQPDLLDPGLSVHSDPEGVEDGVGFETEVGSIDLLARNAKGEYVVVMVLEGGEAAAGVTGVLLRMGWVAKHVAGAETAGVRGIVLLEDGGDDLGYTAAAVADRVDFRTWQMRVSFEALDLD